MTVFSVYVQKTGLALFILLILSGCAASTPRWRDDALNRFNSAVTAGSQTFAPEETDNIRQTLKLADRYFSKQMIDDADRLYQLSCQKSQLLYRNLILSKVRQGTSLLVESGNGNMPEEIVIDREPVSISETLRLAEETGGKAPVSGAPGGGDSPINQASKAVSDASISKSAAADRNTPPYHETNRTSKRTASKPTGKGNSAGLVASHDPGSTTIYLTFDDGPSRLTLPIAGYLKSQGIAATFFVLGNSVKGHENAVRATVAMGHRVGNHTLSHDLRKLNESFNQDVSEVGRTAAIVEKLGGDGRMVRIPYGASTKTMVSKVAAEGGQIFDWDINSYDSTKRGAKDHSFIEQSVISQLNKSGKRHIILLFHDGPGHESTLAAIRNLVPSLKEKGYRFGLLSRSDRVAKTAQERHPIP